MPKKIKDIKYEDETIVVPSEPVKPEAVPTSNQTVQEQLRTGAEQQKAWLDAQPKVSILIPLEKGEKKGAEQPFTINGYRFTVPKGQMVQVPEQVAEMVAERFNIELEVRSQSLENRDEKTKEALA